jgi:hypothetical protein
MEQAYVLGDHYLARSCARELLDAAPEAEVRAAAERVLGRTEPDALLPVIGALGLGLLVWLVYAYVL